ncbi:hypothetical protein AVEN_104503-1 [Araneus ventricosus]|uniref:Uncharacterized protein n=1 Tax=Araneus ventricosus TaxID=182803 RepID=A0A4Y2M8T4_ARAVE|nr:hypothetical protein AVEN_104503-1 [Araneus ventricosus]
MEYCTPYFHSKVAMELDTSMIGDHIEQAFEKIKESFNEFLKNGYCWVFDSVIHMELKTATYHLGPPAVTSLFHPTALHPVGKPQRVYRYASLEQELRLGNVTCPVQPCKVPIIENLNNLRINMFGFEDDEVFPFYISKREDIQVINLLYITQGNDKHY